MKHKNILVTGGAGFIGSHLVDRLLTKNVSRVTVVDNFDEFYSPLIKRKNIASHLRHPAYQLVEADICNYESLEQICKQEPFDAIVHLAARAGVRPSLDKPRTYEKTNIKGTLNMLELARNFNIKQFVFGSSSSVYGPDAVAPFREDAALFPISPYATTKAAGELMAYNYSYLYGIRAICLRFFTVYGARQRPDLAIHKFAKLMSEGRAIPVFGDGSSERDFTFIDDIINGIMAALDYEASPFEIINLGESQTITLTQLISFLQEAFDKPVFIDRRPAQPGDMPRTHADIGKARKLLNYQPTTPIEAGIRKFAEWFKREVELQKRMVA